jgi:hypothetical protein
MSRYQCNTCGEIYSDVMPHGRQYYHVCTQETIEHAQCDDAGKIIKPEKRTPRENVRNENVKPGLICEGGKYILRRPDPNDSVKIITEEVQSIIIAEGAGRTLVE